MEFVTDPHLLPEKNTPWDSLSKTAFNLLQEGRKLRTKRAAFVHTEVSVTPGVCAGGWSLPGDSREVENQDHPCESNPLVCAAFKAGSSVPPCG